MIVTRDKEEILLQKNNVKAFVRQNKSITVQQDSPYTIDWPGEYDLCGITVRGFESEAGKIAFQVTAEEIRMFFPAEEKFELTEQEQQELGNIDILFLSTESTDWPAKDFKKLIEEIEPRIVFFTEQGEKTISILKEIGETNAESIKKKDISVKNLPSDKTAFFILE